MRSVLGFAAVIGLGLFGASGAMAQVPDVGAALYGDFCAACHGAGGLGDGDMADVVAIPAANLTLLAKNNDGDFPMLRVIQVIDGRTGLRAHGTVMPMWGRIFAEQSAAEIGLYGSVLETRGRILSLALYLESLQK